MKYMLLIYSPEEDWADGEREQCMKVSNQVREELVAQGKCLDASPLYSVDMATTLRVRHGKREITDGPFAETREQLGGYYILDVDDLDEAIEIASRLPPVQKGSIEIRPLEPIPT